MTDRTTPIPTSDTDPRAPLPRASIDEDATELWTPVPDEPYSLRPRISSTSPTPVPVEMTMTLPAEPPPPPPTRSWLWMAIVAVTLIAAAAAYILLR